MSPDEILQLSIEIVDDAANEIFEISRREMNANVALGAVIIALFSKAITISHAHYVETGKIACSRETLHRKLDQLWNELDGKKSIPG